MPLDRIWVPVVMFSAKSSLWESESHWCGFHSISTNQEILNCSSKVFFSIFLADCCTDKLQWYLSKPDAFDGEDTPKSAIMTVFDIVLWVLDIWHSVGDAVGIRSAIQ